MQPNLYGKCDKHPDCHNWVYRSGNKFCAVCWKEFEDQTEKLRAEERKMALGTLKTVGQVIGRRMRGW